MNWRKWKLGMVVAVLTGALTGFTALAVGVTIKQSLFLVAISAAKDVLLFLKSHPIEDVRDTTIIKKNNP